MVNGGLLRLGVFLLAVGGILLLGQSGGLDRELVRRALGLWPVAVILIGGALVLRKSPFGLPAGVLAAAVPGLLLGGLFVVLPDVGAHCRTAAPAGFETQQGTFDADSNVDLTIACGDLTVTTMPGSGWETRIGQGSGPMPTVVASGDALRVGTPRNRMWFGSAGDGHTVEVRLPTERQLNLKARVDAGHARLDLQNARLSMADLAVSAGKADVNLTGATLSRLSLRVNAGGANVVLPSTNFGSELEVNGGELQVCVPADLGLRVHEDVSMGSIDHPDLGSGRGSSTWESGGYAGARYHAELSITVNVGSVHINPAGGCQ